MKKYIPNLIPVKHRVLPDYFKETTTTPDAQQKASYGWWFVCIPLFLLATIIFPFYSRIKIWLHCIGLLLAIPINIYIISIQSDVAA